MSKAIEVPEIGESVESGIVVAVHIQAGDTVAIDDTVIELETDKALVEIPSPYAGRVTEVLVEAGAKVKVGDVIARVEETEATPDAQDEKREERSSKEADGASDKDSQRRRHKDAASRRSQADEARGAQAAEKDNGDNKEISETADAAPDQESQRRQHKDAASRQSEGKADSDMQRGTDRPPVPASPSIRRAARELGVNIHAVEGSGPGGRIQEEDIKQYVRRQQSSKPDKTSPSAGHPALPDFSRWGAVDVEELDTVRHLTAQSTAASWLMVPHVTQFDEADITGVNTFIDANSRKAKSQGVKLTLTAIVAKVCAEALKRFPRFNASIDIDAKRIIYKRYVHIGIAVDTPRGLLVPVIRDADRKRIFQLAKNIADLAQRARSKKIKPDELEGGSFSISNQGGIGGVGFTPIVLWPQAAILGISRATVKPVYVQDRFEPKTILPLSLSYDHRIIDGADAARFLRWICEGLEYPMNLLLD